MIYQKFSEVISYGLVNRKEKTLKVRVGNVYIGGDAPVSIQSMTNTKTSDVKATVGQIKELEKAGCDIVRVAVRDMQSALAMEEIKGKCPFRL